MLELLGVQRRAEQLVLQPVAQAVGRQLDAGHERRRAAGAGRSWAQPGFRSLVLGSSVSTVCSVSTGLGGVLGRATTAAPPTIQPVPGVNEIIRIGAAGVKKS